MNHGTSSENHYPIAPPASERRVLGHAVPRIEDVPLVTGRGRYAGDINFPHQLHMRIVRSTRAHARIVSVDATAALDLPGVVAVWTNADIAELSPIDFRADKNATGIREFRQPALAKTFVRYRPRMRPNSSMSNTKFFPLWFPQANRPASSSRAAAAKPSFCATATAISKKHSAKPMW